MSRSSPAVTQFELAVLQVLWESPDVPIRDIADRLYGGASTSQYYTVQKLLERLEGKGLVTRDRDGRTHRFRAAIDRSQFVGDRLQDLADTVCEGSMAPLLTGLLHTRSISAEDVDVLRKLVDDLEARTRKEPGRRRRS